MIYIYCYRWSMTPVMYPASFFFKEPSTAYIFLIVINLFTGITCIVSSFLLEIFSYDKVCSFPSYRKILNRWSCLVCISHICIYHIYQLILSMLKSLQILNFRYFAHVKVTILLINDAIDKLYIDKTVFIPKFYLNFNVLKC